MKAIAIALPCLISGLLIGAINLSQAGPLPQPDGGPQFQQQAQRVNLVTIAKMDSSAAQYGCFPGLDLLDCIADPVSELDTDSTFKLMSAPGTLHCGSTPMVQGSTCTYANATYGLDCEGRCGSPTIFADQTFIAPL